MATAPASRSRKTVARLLAVLIIVAAIVVTVAYRWWAAPLSEDATLTAEIVHISTPVAGKVTAFYVSENARVKKGDLLFELDPTTYALRVEQVRAELRAAEAALATRRRQILAERSNAEIAAEQVQRARANLELAEKTYRRLEPLGKKGYVTAQQVDDARLLYRDAQTSLNQAIAQESAANNLVGEVDAAEALVEVNRVNLAIAERALSDTKVRAPHDGLVVGLAVSSGEHVLPDQALFTLINTERWYASAFFRETDLTDVRPGSCARVYVMADASIPIRGRVESIGWGITTTDIIELPRTLPVVQKSLNWVRVAQRFPVRVLLEDAPEDLLRMGASAVVVIPHGDDC